MNLELFTPQAAAQFLYGHGTTNQIVKDFEGLIIELFMRCILEGSALTRGMMRARDGFVDNGQHRMRSFLPVILTYPAKKHITALAVLATKRERLPSGRRSGMGWGYFLFGAG
jgi:hypothetical protein